MGAIKHTTVPCTFLSGFFYTLICLSILKELLLSDCTRLSSVSLGRRSQSRRRWLCSLTGMRSLSVIASVSRGFPVSETTGVSFRTLSSCYPLKTFCHFSPNADVSSSMILDQYSRLNSFIPASSSALLYLDSNPDRTRPTPHEVDRNPATSILYKPSRTFS